MKYKFEITISEVKGLGEGPFEYKISLDSMEQFLSDTDTFEIYGEGQFTLTVYVNQEEKGATCFPLQLLHKATQLKAPLSNSPQLLTELSEEAQEPYALLVIQEQTILSPVIERREASECSYFPSPEVPSPHREDVYHNALTAEMRQKDTAIAGFKSQIESLKARLQEMTSSYSKVYEQLQNLLEEKQQTENKLLQELKLVENRALQTQSAKEMLELEMEELRQEHSMAKQQINRLQLISDQPSTNELNDLRNKLKESEDKRIELQQALQNAYYKWENLCVNRSTEAFLEKENRSLLSQVETLQEKLSHSEKTISELRTQAENQETQKENTLSNRIAKLSTQLCEAQEKNDTLNSQHQTVLNENEELKKALQSLKSENQKLQESETKPRFREKQPDIDALVEKYMKENNIKNPFQKISQGLYTVNNKKVTISLRNGVPVVRVGGGYMFINEFLRIYLGIGKKEESSRPSSVEPDFKKAGTAFYEDIMGDISNASPLRRSATKRDLSRPTKSSLMKKVPSRESTPVARTRRQIL